MTNKLRYTAAAVTALLLLHPSAQAQSSATTTANATNLAQHQDFRGGQLEYSDQQSWYRELRLSDWQQLGLTQDDLNQVLPRIHGTAALRDQINPNENGFWTYEWSQQAQRIAAQAHATPASQQAQTLALHQRASALFLVASYPNHGSDAERAALQQSVQHYVRASALRQQRVDIVNMPAANGIKLTGLLHLPTNISAPVATILWTGGVDKTLVEHQHSLQRYLDSGYAVLTFDMPGGGLNETLPLAVGNEAAAHNAALAFVAQSPLLDANRVAALTSSGGGISLMEFVLQNPSLKASVARCALVDGVLTQPQKFKFLPKMSVDSLFARFGLRFDELSNPGSYSIPLSLKTKGYFDGKPHTQVPLLVINTKADRVASPADMHATAALSSDSEVAFFGDAGHCPEGPAAEAKIYDFISSRL